ARSADLLLHRRPVACRQRGLHAPATNSHALPHADSAPPGSLPVRYGSHAVSPAGPLAPDTRALRLLSSAPDLQCGRDVFPAPAQTDSVQPAPPLTPLAVDNCAPVRLRPDTVRPRSPAAPAVAVRPIHKPACSPLVAQCSPAHLVAPAC